MNYWTPEEDQILRDLYSTTSRALILDELIGRSWEGVRKRAGMLGLKRPGFKVIVDDDWTDAEKQVVRDMYESGERDAILAALPRRTWKAVMKQGRSMGVKRDRSLANKRATNPYTEKIKLRSERKVMDYLIDYHRQWGAGPMREEIASATGVKCTTLKLTLERLEEKKLIVFPQVGRRLPVYLAPAIRRKLDKRDREIAAA